jgi:hypothetical protein
MKRDLLIICSELIAIGLARVDVPGKSAADLHARDENVQTQSRMFGLWERKGKSGEKPYATFDQRASAFVCRHRRRIR